MLKYLTVSTVAVSIVSILSIGCAPRQTVCKCVCETAATTSKDESAASEGLNIPDIFKHNTQTATPDQRSTGSSSREKTGGTTNAEPAAPPIR